MSSHQSVKGPLMRQPCLLLLLFIIFSIYLSGAASAKPYNTSTWMADMKDDLYDYSLLDITLPGTHDSGMNLIFY